jgi:hypothetical protein
VELPKATELKKLIKFCRENGISHLKHGEFEVSLSPAAHFPEGKAAPDSNPSTPPEELINEMDVLLWSAAGLPEAATEASV